MCEINNIEANLLPTVDVIETPFSNNTDRQIQEMKVFFERIGEVPEDRVIGEQRAENMRNKRKKLYHDIHAILRKYRSLRRTKDTIIADIEERAMRDQLAGYNECNGSFFDYIAHKLDLINAVDERYFTKAYKPYIETGRQIATALDTVQMGVRLYQAVNPNAAAVIQYMFIDGEDQPTVAQVCSEFSMSSTKYYSIIDKGVIEITKKIFGYYDEDHKKEFRSLLCLYAPDDQEPDFDDDDDE